MLDKNEFAYKLIKSKKYKRITISIKKSQKVVVSSPKYVSNVEINTFVNSRKVWITNNLKKLENNTKTKKHTFLNGDSFLFLGHFYTLKIYRASLEKVYLDDIKKELIIKTDNINSEEIKKIILKFYKYQTSKIVYHLIEEKKGLKKINNKINSIKVNKANTRWGSCSSKNNINFSNRLFMLPLSCIEYVIYHEVTHLEIKNHSKDFYSLLKELYPNYKKQEKIIRNYESQYNLTID